MFKAKKETKILIKYFLLFFLLAFFIINWNEISWIFNYQTSSFLLSDFIENFKGKQGLAKEEDFVYDSNNSFIYIPKLKIEAPLIFSKNLDIKEITNDLNKGVVHFPSSALPGQKGQTVILGHSAPLGWPKIKYQWVFSEINKLQEGDEVIIKLQNKELKYKVKKQVFLKKGEDLPELLTNSYNVLILISCWPPGKNIKRIAVAGELEP
jgi:LPXTG-site transpeptidase (sortase) family protein